MFTNKVLNNYLRFVMACKSQSFNNKKSDDIKIKGFLFDKVYFL